VNLLVNPGLNGIAAAYPFNGAGSLLPPQTYPLGLKYIGNQTVPTRDASAISPRFEQKAFLLRADTGAFVSPTLNLNGYDNLFRFQLDQTAVGGTANLNIFSGGSTDYLLGGAAVVPLDIRIEAMLYAQEKSFFVIPGYNFNPDPTDTRLAWLNSGADANTRFRPSYNIAPDGSLLDSGIEKALKDAVPFFGEPMDVRITVFGAVAENYTATSGDQSAWMSKWGYLPVNHGATQTPIPDIHVRGVDPAPLSPGTDTRQDYRTPTERAQGIARGLRFVYDPALGYPYMNPAQMDLDTRQTRFNRALRYIQRPAVIRDGNTVLPEMRQILPPMPKLPVCPGLLYFGSADRQIGS
jgi:hypothetical protein